MFLTLDSVSVVPAVIPEAKVYILYGKSLYLCGARTHVLYRLKKCDLLVLFSDRLTRRYSTKLKFCSADSWSVSI